MGGNEAEFLCLPEVSLEMSGLFLNHPSLKRQLDLALRYHVEENHIGSVCLLLLARLMHGLVVEPA